MNWLLPDRVPSIDMVDGELVSNGRTYPADSGVNITPGAKVAMVRTMPSLRGSSMMVRLSTTRPMEAVDVSSSRLSALTSTVCDDCPSSNVTLTANWSFTRTLIPVCV